MLYQVPHALSFPTLSFLERCVLFQPEVSCPLHILPGPILLSGACPLVQRPLKAICSCNFLLFPIYFPFYIYYINIITLFHPKNPPLILCLSQMTDPSFSFYSLFVFLIPSKPSTCESYFLPIHLNYSWQSH